MDRSCKFCSKSGAHTSSHRGPTHKSQGVRSTAAVPASTTTYRWMCAIKVATVLRTTKDLARNSSGTASELITVAGQQFGAYGAGAHILAHGHVLPYGGFAWPQRHLRQPPTACISASLLFPRSDAIVRQTLVRDIEANAFSAGAASLNGHRMTVAFELKRDAFGTRSNLHYGERPYSVRNRARNALYTGTRCAVNR